MRSDDHHEPALSGDEGSDPDFALPEGLALPLDDAPGPAKALEPAATDALVRGALDAWSPPAPPATSSLFRFAAAAAALVTLATLATAAVLLWLRPGVSPAEPARPDAPMHESPAPELPIEASTTELSLETEEDEVIAPPELVAPEQTPSRPHVIREAPAEDLLAEANALRGAGRFREAEALYQRVARTERGSFTGYVAEVAAAGVRMEHLHDGRGALAGYRRALAARPGGPLDAEAREGEARALRTIGDRGGEERALDALVAAHPSSPQAQRARARLTQLRDTGTR